jgi:hypothetical protein
LAADDLPRARAAGLQLADSVVPVTAEMPDKLRPRWSPLAVEIADHGRYLHGRDDLSRARLAFRRLSERVVVLLQIFGNPLDRGLRLLHCDRDFEQNGAYWLQTDEAAGNPYRAQTAEACGRVQAEVAPGAHLQRMDTQAPKPRADSPDQATSGDAHAGHRH